ncbi:MAG: hypothetical protein V5A23_06415 [Halobacteriales archaeon]
MVRGTSEAERDHWDRLLRLTFVSFVAASAGLIALQGNASLPEVGVVALFGAWFGAVLQWYLLWIGFNWSGKPR